MNNRVDIHLSGLSTRPSDYACSDGDLAVCHNLINEGGELKPIFPLKTSFAIPPNHIIRFTHKTSDGTVYIFRKSVKVGGVTTVSWYYCNSSGHTGSSPDESGTAMFTAWVSEGTGDLKKLEKDSAGNVLQGEFDTINAIGNILIFTDAEGQDSYFRYANGSYNFLGHHLPRLPKIVFSLNTVIEGKSSYKYDANIDGLKTDDNTRLWPEEIRNFVNNECISAQYNFNTDSNGCFVPLDDDDQELCFSVGMSVLAKGHRLRSEAGAFDQPFFVRYAYRLYDGTHARISPPVLLTPTDKCFCPVMVYLRGIHAFGKNDFHFYDPGVMSFLYYSIVDEVDISEWEDIIEGIDVYVSSTIYTYDLNPEVSSWKNGGMCTASADFGKLYGKVSTRNTDSLSDFENSESVEYTSIDSVHYSGQVSSFTSTGGCYFQYFKPLYKTELAIKKNISDVGPFYLVSSINLSDTITFPSFKRVNIEQGVLTSLESREILTDDYLSNYNINGKKFVYNHRLLSFDCSRDYILDYGFSMLNQYVYSASGFPAPTLYVKIKKNGEAYVSEIGQTLGDLLQKIGPIMYPDPDAISITVSYSVPGAHGTTINAIKEYPLTRHPVLNCAYYDIPVIKEEMEVNYGSIPTGQAPDNVPLMSRVYMSEVDNPFVFPAGLTCTAGSGTVMALAATTLPISEGQQGQFPVMAFTDEGIWALSISSTGSITATNPMLRDVLLSREQLCNIDNGVVYATEKGIMMLVGGRSTCITTKLEDDFFNTDDLTYTNYLQTTPVKLTSNFNSASKLPVGILPSGSVKDWIGSCRIYYAGALNRIIVTMPSNDGISQVGSNSSSAALVYSIGSGEWSTMSWGKYTDAYNSYPYTFVHNVVTKTVTGTGVGSTLTTTTTHVNVVSVSSEDKDSLQTCVALTRPLNFGYKDIPKTVFESVVRGTFSVYAMPQIWDGINMKWNRIKRPSDLTCALYGSNNLTDWFLINYAKAEFLRGQTGTPFKYFRLLIVADKTLSGVESITGATFDVQQRLNDTLR